MMNETWETTVKIKLVMQQLLANVEQIRERREKREKKTKQNKERRSEINESFQLGSEDILSLFSFNSILAFEWMRTTWNSAKQQQKIRRMMNIDQKNEPTVMNR